jgi:hypothetical protein
MSSDNHNHSWVVCSPKFAVVRHLSTLFVIIKNKEKEKRKRKKKKKKADEVALQRPSSPHDQDEGRRLTDSSSEVFIRHSTATSRWGSRPFFFR